MSGCDARWKATSAATTIPFVGKAPDPELPVLKLAAGDGERLRSRAKRGQVGAGLDPYIQPNKVGEVPDGDHRERVVLVFDISVLRTS